MATDRIVRIARQMAYRKLWPVSSRITAFNAMSCFGYPTNPHDPDPVVDTWNVPTLVRLRTQELADCPEYLSDPALPYIPAESLEAWREVTEKFHKLPPAMHATYREAYQRQLALTKLFDDAGVRMMVGTDGGGHAPGQSIHQEFDELAKAGLSPLKILQMTTLNPAEFLDRTSTMGSIDVGKNADIVLLDGNPIESVQNLHSISGVVRAGIYYSHADLDALRERAKEPRPRSGP
jgi:imidazolonepropionase-like amidohydrolase